MPRRARYSLPDTGTDPGIQDTNAHTSRKNKSFHPLHRETQLALIAQNDAVEDSIRGTVSQHLSTVVETYSEDEDYKPDAEEVESWDDHLDNLFAEQEAEGHKDPNSRKDTDYWNVDVFENGVTKQLKVSINEAIGFPRGKQIVLDFNEEMQPIGEVGGLLSGFLGNLGADYTLFSIGEENWKRVSKSLKEHAYDTVKLTFRYEEDAGSRKKKGILQKIGKNWKDTLNNIFHKFCDEGKSFEENLKRKPSRINSNEWKSFLKYRLNEATKAKCRQNKLNRSKQLYTHTRGSKTLTRRKDEEEKKQKKHLSRGDMWAMVHKRKDGSYIHDDARAISEAINNIQSQDESSKEISANDSLAQVLRKEYPGRVHGVGFGPCPTQILGKTSKASSSVVPNEEYEKKIEELEAKVAEEKAKRQTMENLLRYLIQQQGDTLPPDVAADLNSLGN